MTISKCPLSECRIAPAPPGTMPQRFSHILYRTPGRDASNERKSSSNAALNISRCSELGSTTLYRPTVAACVPWRSVEETSITAPRFKTDLHSQDDGLQVSDFESSTAELLECCRPSDVQDIKREGVCQ
jgi:hypothetical protein